MPDAEIYFVSNQKYCTDEIEATFRVSGKVPELWNPETGAVEKAPLFREVEGRTVVPLRLDASGSVFVVFRAPAAGDHLVSDKVTPDQPVAKQALRILTASYGTFDRKSQPHVIDLTSTKAATVKRILTPLRFAGRDPAPDACKYMLAQYTVDGVFKSQAAPEDGALEMPQLPQTFKMIRVLYGVLSAKPTAADQTLDVTAKLNSLVTNGTLSVMVNKDLSGQMPASSKPKELRVEYLYNGRWNIAFMPEGQRLELPGAYEAEAAPATHELGVKPDGQIELRAWVAGRYEFTTAAGKTLCARVENVVAPQELIGAWAVMFPPDLGAPPCALFDRLMSWTESSDEGVKYFSGTATYSKEINIPAELVRQDGSLYLDLGKVKNIAQVYLNGQDMGVLWKPPFRVNISGAVRSGANKLEIKVTNLWPNRLIADERLKPDREWTSTRNLKAWPQWLLDGKPSPSGQITFTTAQHWQKDDALLPSGLFGPVRLFSTKNRVLTD
jgi:hypothetical protein